MHSVDTISKNPEQTRELAAAIAPWLRPGDVLLLIGGLAAGKTFFVQELVRALGSVDDVRSPTFAIANFYETRAGPFIHVDAYRLSGTKEYEDLGLEEFAESSIMAIEWGDRILDAFEEYLAIEFDFEATSDSARKISLTPAGSRWVPVVMGLRSIPQSCK